ncbi:MAG: TonB-dependent receptor [Flavobacteriaceae bacterium]|nr:TonB-dependent receptor [Flavobacteriaceae bacterium]
MKNLLTLLALFLGANLLYTQEVSIRGTVVDEFGYPLAGAEVLLVDTLLGAQTDIDGIYIISGVAPGSYNLSVRFLGYEPQTLFNIIVKSKGNPEYNFSLSPKAEALEGVVLQADNFISRPKESPLSTRTLSAVELATYPGGNNDVVQVAQTLPGVSPSVGGFRNDLIIRGGAPNESVYYLDGIEIPNINHFSTQGSAGGPVGMINVSFIENVTLSASSFDARYDNALSGVLQFEQRKGSSEGWNRNIRVSASETALTFDGPISEKTTFIGSVRRSYLQFLFELIGLPIRPDYWDYQYKIDHTIDEYNSISFIGIGAIDDFSVEAPEIFDEEATAQLEQAPFIDQRTHVAGISWQHKLKSQPGKFTLSLSHNRLQNTFTQYTDPENESGAYFINESIEAETKLRFDLVRYLGKLKWSYGMNLQRSNYENNTTIERINNSFFSAIEFSKYGLFTQLSGNLGKKTEFTLGLRLDDDSFTKNNLLDHISPRAALTYNFNEDLSATLGLGRYFKIPTYTQLGYQSAGIFVNENLNYVQSDHLTAGIKKYFGNTTLLSIEGFLKSYSNYPVSVLDEISLANKGAGFEVLGNEEVESSGKGRSYGLELLYQQKLSNNFYGLFSYTYFFSEFSGLDPNIYRRSTWDSRHLASFTGGYKLNKNWEISSRFRYNGKTPYAPIDETLSLANYPDLRLDYDLLGNQNYLLDPFSQLDLRIDKKWNFTSSSFNLFIEVQNLLSADNPTPPEYGLARNSDGSIKNPSQLKELPRSEGQFIPSIGLVFDF